MPPFDAPVLSGNTLHEPLSQKEREETMTMHQGDITALPTIWSIPDALWEVIAPILDELDPQNHEGASESMHEQR